MTRGDKTTRKARICERAASRSATAAAKALGGYTGGSSGMRMVAMYGKSNFLSKLICVFMDMEKMVGPDFDAGLAGLKALAEKPAA